MKTNTLNAKMEPFRCTGASLESEAVKAFIILKSATQDMHQGEDSLKTYILCPKLKEFILNGSKDDQSAHLSKEENQRCFEGDLNEYSSNSKKQFKESMECPYIRVLRESSL